MPSTSGNQYDTASSPSTLIALQNLNTSNSSSTNSNYNTNVSTSHSWDVSASTSDATSHSYNESNSISTDTSFVTSNSTSDSTSRSYSESVSTDNSVSNATSHSTSVSTANNVSFSQSDIEVSLNNIIASNYKADQDLAGVQLHESSETDRLMKKLAFADSKFQFIAPLLAGVLETGSSSGSGSSSGGSIGFHASLRPMGFVSPQVEQDYTAQSNGGFGFYSRRTSMVDTGNLRMGGGDTKTGGIGFASGGSVADAVAATQLPFIRTCGVLTPAQIQATVSAAAAKNDTRTQSEIRKLTGELSGRGFSSNSPILAALRVGLAAQNLRATLEGTTQIQIESAKANSEAIFNGQKAVSDQYIQQEGVMVENAKNDTTRAVGVLGAIAQMVSSAL